jgi:hypothetical protein
MLLQWLLHLPCTSPHGGPCSAAAPCAPCPQAWLQQLACLPRLTRLALSKESLLVLRSLHHKARPQSLYVMALPPAIGQLTALQHLALVPCDTPRPLQGHVQVGGGLRAGGAAARGGECSKARCGVAGGARAVLRCCCSCW